MDSFRELGRTLLMLGGLLIVVGAFFFFGGKLPFRMGRLPGDIVHKGDHTTFYFPIVSCIVLSVGLSLLFWLISAFDGDYSAASHATRIAANENATVLAKPPALNSARVRGPNT